jgi:hypothetical protein
MCHILLLSVAYSAITYFSTLSRKLHNLWKNVIEHKMHVVIFCITLVGNISHSKKNSVRFHKCTYIFM